MSVDLGNKYDSTLIQSGTRNQVMRNTYWLLALSMLPTVLGAWLGVQMKFALLPGSPLIGFIVCMAIFYGFIYAIERTKNSALGVAFLLGLTFFLGLLMSRLIAYTLGFSNGGALIMTAFAGTGSIFAVMATVATVSKRDFSGMGQWLGVGMLVMLVAAVANIFLQLPALHLVLLVMILAISSAFLLYNVQQVINGGETNYIIATLSIYINLYNIFTTLLQLLGIFGGDRD